VLAAAQAGLAPATTVLQLLQALRHETDYVVWSALAGALGEILSVVEDEKLRTALERFGHWFNQPARERLGWEAKAGESVFDTMLRPGVLQQAIRFDDRATVAEARRQFAHFMETGEIDPNLRPAIAFAVARHGQAADFDVLLNLYRREQVPQVKLGWLAALGRFRQPELTQRSLDLGLSPEVRPQDTIYSIAYGLMNRDGREIAWRFVQDHWPTFLERYGSGGHMLENFPQYVGLAFATHARAAEVRDFFAARPHPAITRPVAQAVESIELGADWYDRDQEALAAWLSDWQAGQ
jgi:aminopeptidase 2